MTIKITLPIPPSVNALYAQAPRHQRYKTYAYKNWIKKAESLHRSVVFFDVPPKKGETVFIQKTALKKCRIEYTFFFKDERTRDCSNFLKATEDFLVSNGFIEDDNWKCLISFSVNPASIDKKNPRVEIAIEEVK